MAARGKNAVKKSKRRRHAKTRRREREAAASGNPNHPDARRAGGR